MKIIGMDNLARETIADTLLIPWVPKHYKEDAEKACAFLNKFTCDGVNGGTFYKVVDDNYRLSKGMEDLV